MGYPKTILSYPYPIFVLSKINPLKYKNKSKIYFREEFKNFSFFFFFCLKILSAFSYYSVQGK